MEGIQIRQQIHNEDVITRDPRKQRILSETMVEDACRITLTGDGCSGSTRILPIGDPCH